MASNDNVTNDVLAGMSDDDIRAIVAKAKKEAARRADYRKTYFAREDVKERRAAAREREKAMLERAFEAMCENFTSHPTIGPLIESYRVASVGSSKRGELRMRIMDAIDTDNG